MTQSQIHTPHQEYLVKWNEIGLVNRKGRVETLVVHHHAVLSQRALYNQRGKPEGAWLTRLSQLAVKHPSNGRISGGVVPQGRHHRMDGDYAIGMPSVVILGGGWSGKLILSR